MCAGAALLVAAQLGSSWLFSQPGQMGGIVWSICTGTGIFLGYVPIGAMFYDRLIGALRCPGTAVFMINAAEQMACCIEKNTKFRVPRSLKILNLNSCGAGLTGDVSAFNLHEGLVELALDKSGLTGDLAKFTRTQSPVL